MRESLTMNAINMHGRRLRGDHRRWLVAACLLLPLRLSAGAAAQGGPAPEPVERMVTVSPVAACQTALAELRSAGDLADMEARIDRLLAMHGQDRDEFLAQLLFFAARPQADAASRAVAGHVLKRLDASKQTVAAAVAPHLDNTDEAIRAAAREVLIGLEDRSASRPADFSAYHAIIEADVRAGRALQASLVCHMYESDPGQALLTMLRAHQLRRPEEIRPILWAEHVIADLFWRRTHGFVERKAVTPEAVAELDRLSISPHWWARLYVAENVCKHPELATEQIIERLPADESALVRGALARFSSGK